MARKDQRKPTKDAQDPKPDPPLLDGEGQREESSAKTTTQAGQDEKQGFFFFNTRETWWNMAMSICTIVLAACAIIAIVITHGDIVDQSAYTKQSVDIASRTFQWQRYNDSLKSIDQHKKDSLLTLSQERRDSLARQVSQSDVRAYFSVVVSNPVLTRGKRWKVQIEAKNIGKTPAYNMSDAESMRIGTGVYKLDIDSLENNIVESDQTISPGVSFTYIYEQDRIFTDRDSVLIYSPGPFKMNVFGMLRYKDKFGVPRFVHYAYWYDTRINRMSVYHNFNDAN